MRMFTKYWKSVMFFLMLAFIMSPNKLVAQESTVQLYGDLINSGSWDPNADGKYGIYSFPAINGTTFTPVSVSKNFEFSTAAYGDGKYFGYNVVTYSTYVLRITYRMIDANGWTVEKEANLSTSRLNQVVTMAYNPMNKVLYAEAYNEDGTGTRLCTVNQATGELTEVASLDDVFFAMAFDKSGKLYGISETNLKVISTTDGTSTAIGFTGVSPKYNQGLTIDAKTGRMFWMEVGNDQISHLYEVNLTKGLATEIHNFQQLNLMVGLYSQSPQVMDDAPDDIEDLTFKGANVTDLNGNITFTAPLKSVTGADLTGNLTVHLFVDYAEVALTNNTVAPGATFSLAQTFTEGVHVIEAYVSNDKGSSMLARKRMYVGTDKPEAVKNLLFTLNDNHATVTWDASTTGANGGYFDTSKLSYTVTRYPGAVVVAQNLTTTKFEEDLPNTLGHYYYKVVPSAEKEGVEAISNAIDFGPSLEVPYLETFDTEDGFNIYKAIDTNEDGHTWTWNSSNKSVMSSERSGSNQASNWLITPPIKLSTDYVYKLSFRTHAYGTYYTETLGTAYGQGQTIDAMTNALGDYTVQSETHVEHSSIIRINESGDYNFGFQHKSTGFFGDLYVDSIAVSIYASTAAPDTVTNFILKAGDKGALTMEGSFNAPTKAINGDALTTISKIEIYLGNTLISTLTNVEPGSAHTFTSSISKGSNLFRVIVYNEAGNGIDAMKSVFGGIDYPGAVNNLKAVWNEGNDMAIDLTWDVPSEVGQNGGYVDTSALTYDVMTYDSWLGWYAARSGIQGNSYTYNRNTSGGSGPFTQSYVTAGLRAVSATGSSQTFVPFGITIGTPLDSFAESFANGATSTTYWSVGRVAGTNIWGMSIDNSYASAQDEDGGFAMVLDSVGGGQSRLETPIVNLTTVANPYLSFYVYESSKTSSEATLTVTLTVDGTTFNAVAEPMKVSGNDEWKQYNVSLADYASYRKVQFGFLSNTPQKNDYVAIDNMKVVPQSALGIDRVTNSSNITRRYYGVDGIEHKGIVNGLNIIRNSDGTVTKVIKK